ncbi:MAG: hypothetical protein A2X48_16335 [Lentisphaerae bacterium GWF2_49_21]|nr:MAG: hypothetical protein A2X48_16335 [Lentisphaerae bacterium GWF2_49_21]
MNDEKLQAVLKRASEDEVFRYRLLKDRDATVNELDLSDVEKNMLKSVSDEQLEKMLKLKTAWWGKTVCSNSSFPYLTATVTAAALTAISAGLFIGVTSTAGCTASGVVAKSKLNQLFLAEAAYYQKHGTYTDIESLTKANFIDKLSEKDQYQYEIKVLKDDFLITAKHKTRSNRPIYLIDSKGKSSEIKP